MKIISRLILFVLFFSCCNAFAQAPSIQWQKTFGGSGDDKVSSIIQASDGNYLVAGSTESTDSDVVDNKVRLNCWVLQLDASGNVIWKKCFGPETAHQANQIIQAKDKSFLLAGYSTPADGNKTGIHGNDDYWIYKFNSSFIQEFQRTCGGRTDDNAKCVAQTKDGGYIVAGWGGLSGVNIKHSLGGNDYWLVKLNKTGQVKWENSLGGSGVDDASSVVQTDDGGYVLAGYSNSNNLHVTGNHGSTDCWIVKADTGGVIVWQKSIGGSGLDYAYAMNQTRDKGFIISGATLSNDADATGNHGMFDAWIIKTDSLGKPIWHKCIGGSKNDYAYDIHQTIDGGYIVAGATNSNDGDVSGNHGGLDAWIIKLDEKGNILWQKCLGGTNDDEAKSIHQSADGGFIVGASTMSSNGDVKNNKGKNDYWVIKLSK